MSEAVVVVGLEPEAMELERAAVSWPERAKALVVTDEQTLSLASDALAGIKSLRAKIEETFGPIIKRAYEAHREAVAQRKKVEAPLEEAERIIKGSVAAYLAEQERLRQEAERRAREEAERRAAEALERQIEDAESAGASPEDIEAMIDSAPTVVPVVSEPRPRKPEGISVRTTYKAEVTDMLALVRWVASNNRYINLLSVNQSALNQLVRSLGPTAKIPGVRLVAQGTVAVRTR